MTIDFVLEWENAGALEAEEALDFFKALTAHIDVLRGVVPGARVGFVIVFDSLPEPGLQTEIENRLFGDIGADRAVFLLADKADYYSKKQVAALHAQAELLIYCDSDCIYSPCWLPALLAPLLEDRADLCYGQTLAETAETDVERASTLAWFFPTDDPSDPKLKAELAVPIFRANNFAVRRQVMLACPIPIVPGSRTRGGLWLRRLAEHGARVSYIGEASARHRQYDDVNALLDRAHLLGRDQVVLRHLGRKGKRSLPGTLFWALKKNLRERAMLRGRLASPVGREMMGKADDPGAVTRLAWRFYRTRADALWRACFQNITPTISVDYTGLMETVHPIPPVSDPRCRDIRMVSGGTTSSR